MWSVTSIPLLVSGGVSVLSAGAFGYAAREAARRGASGGAGARLASRAHALWWGSLAAYLVIQGALTLAAGFDRLSWGAMAGSRLVTIPLLCVASWGITFYLAYLYTGHARAALPLGILSGITAAVFYYAFYTAPAGVVVERWIIGVDDASPLFRAVYALVGLPPILASVALLLLIPRVRDRERRYRLALLGGSILAYVGSGLAARIFSNDFVIFLTLVVVGLGAAVAAIAAYRPPPSVRAGEVR